MSSGTQVDLDWASVDAVPAAVQAPGPAPSRPSPDSRTEAKYLTDEEILGIEPAGSAGSRNDFVIPSEARNLSSIADSGEGEPERDSLPAGQAGSGANRPRNDKNRSSASPAENGQADTSLENNTQAAHPTEAGQAKAYPTEMPAWMAAAAADPRHAAEAQGLWREHQEFRAAFASPEEARAVKELLPGGVRDVLSLREATQSVERIDAALFSGDARAQAEVVAEIARANPAAFRSLFAEAAKVVAGLNVPGNEAQGRDARSFDGSAVNDLSRRPTLRTNREEWGTRNSEVGGLTSGAGDSRAADGDDSRGDRGSHDGDDRRERRHHSGGGSPGSVPPGSQGASDPPPSDPPDLSGGSAASSLQPRASNLQNFNPAAYAQFERATNDTVARDVRGSISDTLARVIPDGVAEGAARRIGEDIFHEVHRALAADKTLSEQVAAVLRERRFGAAEQQRVSALLAGRARQLVPSVARRVIGEWTSSVLSTARNKAARQAAAASRVDIATPGGSRDSMPLRQMSPHEVNYAGMSDEEILGM